MKTAAQATAKWKASTSVGEQTWVDNLSNTNKPIVQAALAQRAVMQSNFAQATQPGGSWERGLEAKGDAGIKQAARDKRSNYTKGVTDGEGAFNTAITKIIQYEQAGLPAIYSMPKGTLSAGKARANAWMDYMAAGKGQFSA